MEVVLSAETCAMVVPSIARNATGSYARAADRPPVEVPGIAPRLAYAYRVQTRTIFFSSMRVAPIIMSM
jgi:hypothetical protein